MTTTTPSATTEANASAKNIAVQVITQADFDTMTESRQAFIRDRIAAGQVKIVSADDITPPKPPQKPNIAVDPKKLLKANQKPDQKTDQTKSAKSKTADKSKTTHAPDQPKTTYTTRYVYTEPAQRLLTKPVKIILNNGQTCSGVLTELWKYEFILKTVNKDDARIIMKHAVTSIEEDTSQTLITTTTNECSTSSETTGQMPRGEIV